MAITVTDHIVALITTERVEEAGDTDEALQEETSVKTIEDVIIREEVVAVVADTAALQRTEPVRCTVGETMRATRVWTPRPPTIRPINACCDRLESILQRTS